MGLWYYGCEFQTLSLLIRQQYKSNCPIRRKMIYLASVPQVLINNNVPTIDCIRRTGLTSSDVTYRSLKYYFEASNWEVAGKPVNRFVSQLTISAVFPLPLPETAGSSKLPLLLSLTQLVLDVIGQWSGQLTWSVALK